MTRAIPSILRGGLAASAILLAVSQARAATPVAWDYPPRPLTEGKGLELPAPRDGRPASLKIEGRAEGVAIGESGSLSLSVPLREIFPGASDEDTPSSL